MSNETAPKLTFWFEFASTYTYLTLQRIEDAAKSAGVELEWRPILLGPIFGAQGWDTSPFKIYPAKGAFMFRDLERRASAYGLPFKREGILPVNSVMAARLAIAALEQSQGPAFCRRVSFAHWGEGRDISNADVLEDCARAAGFDPKALSARASDPAVKPRLRQNTEDAQSLGVFGAPSFTARGELFWGDDQLEDALAWARTGAMSPRNRSQPR
ncbi:MAG: 2-hydroxychromene-2-carboxylate isomerase [Pseudomonadota bacterium]